jgi:hypothetical protein
MIYESFGRLVSIIDIPATRKHESTAKAGLTASSIHEINRIADGVIIGGGNLYENGEIDIDLTAIKSLQPPLMLFSNSRGRIYSRKNTWIERSDVIPDGKLTSLVEKAVISASRDSVTNGYITGNLGLDKDVVGYCPTINIGKFKSQLPELPQNEVVGAVISIRTPNLMNLPYWRQAHVHQDIVKIIELLKGKGYSRVRLLCNDSRDIEFAGFFEESHKVNSIYTSDVYQYLSILKNAELVVSYRLHATLPSLSLGTPTISIAYDERASCLFDDLRLSDHYIDMLDRSTFNSELQRRIDEGGTLLTSENSAYWSQVFEIQKNIMGEFYKEVRRYIDD